MKEKQMFDGLLSGISIAMRWGGAEFPSLQRWGLVIYRLSAVKVNNNKNEDMTSHTFFFDYQKILPISS